MIGTALYLTVALNVENRVVTVTTEDGASLMQDVFDGPTERVLEFVDEYGITMDPSFKILDKHLQPDEDTQEQVVWHRVPVEYDEDNAPA